MTTDPCQEPQKRRNKEKKKNDLPKFFFRTGTTEVVALEVILDKRENQF